MKYGVELIVISLIINKTEYLNIPILINAFFSVLPLPTTETSRQFFIGINYRLINVDLIFAPNGFRSEIMPLSEMKFIERIDGIIVSASMSLFHCGNSFRRIMFFFRSVFNFRMLGMNICALCTTCARSKLYKYKNDENITLCSIRYKVK